MTPTSFSTIEELEHKIAEAERIIHEEVQFVLTTLRKGGDTAAGERRVRELRGQLERLYAERRKIVRAAHQAQPAPGQSLARSVSAA